MAKKWHKILAFVMMLLAGNQWADASHDAPETVWPPIYKYEGAELTLSDGGYATTLAGETIEYEVMLDGEAQVVLVFAGPEWRLVGAAKRHADGCVEYWVDAGVSPMDEVASYKPLAEWGAANWKLLTKDNCPAA